MRDPDLHLAIESFRFDAGPANLTFAARLARENGWSSDYACCAIREYLRFVYLCAISREPLTPSDASKDGGGDGGGSAGSGGGGCGS